MNDGKRVGPALLFLPTLVVAAALAAGPDTADAVIDCSSTTQVLLNGADPSDNYENDNDDPDHVCIEIQGNGVSDFGSHTVTCTNDNGCGRAIQFTDIDGTSTVRSAVLAGPWAVGIDGSVAPADEKTVADRNRITDVATALYGVDVNTHNVIVVHNGAGAPGCAFGLGFFPTDDLSGAATSQVVEDNFLDTDCVLGIFASSNFTGGTVPKIRRNLIRHTSVGIPIGASGKVHVESNLLLGNASYGAGDVDVNATVSSNVCDQLTASNDAHGLCAALPLPFDLP